MRYLKIIINKFKIKNLIIIASIISCFFAGLSLISLVYPWIYSKFIYSLQNHLNYKKYLYLYLIIVPSSVLLELCLDLIYGKINVKIDEKIRYYLYNVIKNEKETDIKSKGEGYYERIMDTTIYNIVILFTPQVFIRIISIFKYFFIIFILFKYNLIIGTIGLISLFIYFFNYIYNKRIFERNYKRVISKMVDFYSFFYESISMNALFSTFPLFNKKNNSLALKKIKDLNEASRIHGFFGDNIYKLVSKFVIPVLTIILFFYMGKLYVLNKITISIIVLLIGYFSQISSIFDDFDEISKFIRQANVSSKEMVDIIENNEKNIKLKIDNVRKIKKLFFIKFNNVNLKFKNRVILEKLNFVLKLNKIYGLIGMTGEGKTSFISFILNNCENGTGEGYFLNDNINICKYNLKNNILYISQDSYILNDTLEENIKLGNEKKEKLILRGFYIILTNLIILF